MKKCIVFLFIFTFALCAAYSCGMRQEATETAAGAETAETAGPQHTADVAPSDTREPGIAETPAPTPAISKTDAYLLIAVSPEASFTDINGREVETAAINYRGAQALICWLMSAEGRETAEKWNGGDRFAFEISPDTQPFTGDIQKAETDTRFIRVSLSSPINDSGFVGYMLTVFESKYGYAVEVYSDAAAKAAANAEMGNADLVLIDSGEYAQRLAGEGFAALVGEFDAALIDFGTLIEYGG